jgi:hypothetical protein
MALIGMIYFGVALAFWAFLIYAIRQSRGFTTDWIMLLFHAGPALLLFVGFIVSFLLSTKNIKVSLILLLLCLGFTGLFCFIEIQNDFYQSFRPILQCTDKNTAPSSIGEIHEYTNWWWYEKNISHEETKPLSYGYINHKGDMIIEAIYEDASHFSDGFAAVKKNGKWGFINITGKEVLPCIYEETGSFSGGLAPVKRGDQWSYIDKEGKTAFDKSYEIARSFSEELAAVSVHEKWGYINRDGNFVIEPIYSRAGTFQEGLAAVQIDNLYGFIDKKGNYAIQPKFTKAIYFSEGLAPVELNKLWGYINKEGVIIIEPHYDFADPFSNEIARVILIRNKWGYRTKYAFMHIDRKSGAITTKAYCGAGTFSEGLSSKMKGEKYGYINKVGEMVIEPRFDMAVSFHEGLATVGMKKK